MKKRAAAMVVVSALVCGIVAIQAPRSASHSQAQQDDGSATEKELTMELTPETTAITYETQQPVGIVRAVGLKDTLVPASDYGTVFPYAVAITGWKSDGTPVYRYAMADSAGEQITNAVYTSVIRQTCGNSMVWLCTSQLEDGSQQISCAAQDGSWILGPFDGSIVVKEDRIFVQRTNNASVTTVYNSDGKIMGQVTGVVSSCSNDMIVSTETTAAGTVWHLSDADRIEEQAALSAVYVGAFSGDSAVVQLTETQWGFVNTEGTVTNTAATWLDECCEGYALAKGSDGAYGVLDKTGKTVVDMKYLKAVKCSESLPLYQLWESEDSCIVISASSGQKLALPKDLNAQQLIALPETYFAYINEDGNTVLFDDLDSVELEGEVQFYAQGKAELVSAADVSFQLIDLKEGSAGKTHAYQYIAPQEEAAYEDTVFTIADPNTGLQGIGNTRGHTVLAPVYDSISSVDGSYFAATQGNWSGIVDSNGDWIVCMQLIGTN